MTDSDEDFSREDIRLLENTATAYAESRISDGNPKPSVYQRNVILCAIVFFFAELFELGLFAPTTALLERSICRVHYKSMNPAAIGEDGWVAERLCKERPIQADLARIKGWKAVFDCIPVFLVAAPLAKYAGKVGPTKVLHMCFIGLGMQMAWIFFVCSYPDSFPIRLVWLSSIFLLCGGGTMQVAAMVHLLASRHAGKENTGSAFYLINIAYMFDELLAPAVVSITMDISLCIPFALALGYLAVGSMITSVIPDYPTGSEVVPSDEDRHPRQVSDPSAPSISQCLRSLRPVITNRSVLLSIPIFFVGMFRMALISVMMQYPRIRFDWKLSQVTTLFTAAAVFNLVIFLVIVPYWLRYIRSKYSTPDMDIQVGLVRYGLISTAAGCFLIGIAPSAVVLCLGTALFAISQITRPPLLAFVTVSVPESAREDLYGLTQMVENTTLLVAEPILQKLLRIALRWPSEWWGLPFVFASGLYATAVAFSWFLRTS